MELANAKGERFRLTLVGYEFPELETEEYSSNWLLIEVDVTHPRGNWCVQDPCLLTYEVERLANWIEVADRGEIVEASLDFYEPNLEFQLVERDTMKYLRIYFGTEFRPDWAPWGKGIPSGDLWLEFLFSSINFGEVAKSLREQLALYPQRAER